MDQSQEKKVTLNLEEVNLHEAPRMGSCRPIAFSALENRSNDLAQSPEINFAFRIKSKKIQIQNASNDEELDLFSIHQMNQMQF